MISSRLSGNYKSASAAPRKFPGGMCGGGFAYHGGGAFPACQKGKGACGCGLSLHEAASEIERLREKVGIRLFRRQSGSASKSGRLGIVRQSVGTILNIRPVLLLSTATIVSCGHTRAKTSRSVPCLPNSAGRQRNHYPQLGGKHPRGRNAASGCPAIPAYPCPGNLLRARSRDSSGARRHGVAWYRNKKTFAVKREGFLSWEKACIA